MAADYTGDSVLCLQIYGANTVIFLLGKFCFTFRIAGGKDRNLVLKQTHDRTDFCKKDQVKPMLGSHPIPSVHDFVHFA